MSDEYDTDGVGEETDGGLTGGSPVDDSVGEIPEGTVSDGNIGSDDSDGSSDGSVPAEESGSAYQGDSVREDSDADGSDTGMDTPVEPAGTAMSNASDNWFDKVASAAPIKLLALPAGVEDDDLISEMSERGLNVTILKDGWKVS